MNDFYYADLLWNFLIYVLSLVNNFEEIITKYAITVDKILYNHKILVS